MEQHRSGIKPSTEVSQKKYSPERRVYERRTKQSKGYVYISVVGWIDRREKKRRDGDTYKW